MSIDRASTTPRPRAGAGSAPTGPAGRRPSGHPRHRDDPRLDLVRALAALWLEAEVGRRPLSQLFALMDPKLVPRVAARWVSRSGPAGAVRRVAGVVTAPGRFDAVAVVQRGRRAGAICMRLVRDECGWKIVEVACPESVR